MVEKRFHKKMALLVQEIEKPTTHNVQGADCVILGFGSIYGVMKETCETITDKKVGFIHLSQIWPFPIQELTTLLKNAKTLISVENNASAQLARLLRRETGITVSNSILKYDGRPFNLDELIDRLKN